MKKYFIFIILVLILFSTVKTDDIKTKRMVAITIDDLPLNSKLYPQAKDQKRFTIRLLKTLKNNRVPAIGFVNEKKLYKNNKIDPVKVEILNLWLQAGMDLGNHTYSHQDLHKVPVDDFINDIKRGETILRPLMKKRGKELIFFRHPYLHTGRTMEIKEQVEKFLKNQLYRVAPVSIDNSEWIFAFAYGKALGRGDKELADRIADAYIIYMDKMFAYYEKQSRKLFGYEIRQILLIHANVLNSNHLHRLIGAIRKRGYTFISLSKALEDKIYTSKDTYTGPGGITWIHRYGITQGKRRKIFVGEPEVPKFISEIVKSTYK